MTAYIIKHIHVWLVVLSVSGFIVRFFWLQTGSPHLSKKWVKVAPHIVDTFLLLSGLSLALLYGLSPMDAQWFAVKLALIVVYIALGYVALKAPIPKPTKWLAGALAIATIGGIIFCAVYKPVFF